MKLYLPIIILAFSGTIISCNEDMTQQEPVARIPISFEVLDDSATRASSSSNISDFTVYAYDTNGKIFINGADYYADGKSKDGMNYYWPTTGGLSFYAITPSANSNYTFNGGLLTYTVPTDNKAQVDLMTAKAANQTKTTNKGIVNLQFQHALSQVVFKGMTKSSNLSVEIESITIHNVNSVMTIALNGTTTTPTAK